MNSAAVDTASYLASQGAGTFGGLTGWAVYVAKEPTLPDSTITVYDTAGFLPDPDNGVFMPGIQIRIRDSANDYRTAYSKAEEVRDILIYPTDVVLGGTTYIGWFQQGSIEQIGFDDNDRVIVVLNFNIIRQEA